ncbi:hypothetical protein [Desulfosarcina variabilis]|uniref:hypothetical protein n=1 Tax=Desulfosarcina variabilis TaxID=2300 RepID=UPI003AFA4989
MITTAVTGVAGLQPYLSPRISPTTWLGVYLLGMFLVRLIFFNRYLDIFNCFNGALDHLLMRTQFLRRSIRERLSWTLRRSSRLNENRLNEKVCRLSLPLRLSIKDRLYTGMGTPFWNNSHWLISPIASRRLG